VTYEENREFSADTHRIVAPIAQRYVGVRLDYYQQRGAWQGALWRKLGNGLDTASQVILSPAGEILAQHRSYKNGNGLTPEELHAFAERFPTTPARARRLRLSWFLMDREAYGQEVLDEGARERYGRGDMPILEARKVRRPLVRVDGKALEMLERDQAFLERHLRQFWWQKGDPNAPARLVVLNPHQFVREGNPDELTGPCSPDKIPVVMANIGLNRGVQLEKVSPILDSCWRRYMEARPSNADNLTFAKDQIEVFKQRDSAIRALAKAGLLLAPGGRPLLRRVEPSGR
jgi:hypothetical protein